MLYTRARVGESSRACVRCAGTETEDKIRTRMENAEREMAASKTMHFDAYIVNDDLDTAYAQLREATALGRAEMALLRAAGTGATASA